MKLDIRTLQPVKEDSKVPPEFVVEFDPNTERYDSVEQKVLPRNPTVETLGEKVDRLEKLVAKLAVEIEALRKK